MEYNNSEAEASEERNYEGDFKQEWLDPGTQQYFMTVAETIEKNEFNDEEGRCALGFESKYVWCEKTHADSSHWIQTGQCFWEASGPKSRVNKYW